MFAAFQAVHEPWLSQGDVFSQVLIPQVGVVDSQPTAMVQREPALLVSHGCAIDKKRKVNGSEVSRLEYLTFLPIHNAAILDPPDRAVNLRKEGNKGAEKPFEALYLGEIADIGDCYASLAHPFSIPAAFFRPELQHFTIEKTGDVAETRIVPTMGDERIGSLSKAGLELFHRKWAAYWLQKSLKLREPAPDLKG